MAYFSSILFASLVVAALSILTLGFPETITPLTAEDRLIETATALVFLAAFLFTASHPNAFRRWRVVAGCFALIAFLDELSFGERLFGWDAYYISGVKLDGAHDILQISRRAFVAAVPSPWLVAGVIGPLILVCASALVALSPKTRQRLRRLAQSVTPATFLLFAALGFVALSQILDLKLGPLRHPIVKASQVEEYLELMSGILTLSFVLATRKVQGVAKHLDDPVDAAQGQKPRRIPMPGT